MLATYSYDDRGRRTSLVMGDGTSTSYGYDDVSRLTSLGLDLDDGSTTTNDVTKTFTFNPAGQIAGQSVSNSLYIDPLPATVSTSFSRNNLNQPLHFGGSGVPDRDYTWNIRGTLTSEENTSTPHNTISYGYNNLNQLLTRAGSTVPNTTLDYDPAGRLFETVSGGVTTHFAYDGGEIVGEYDWNGTSNVLQRRYVKGAGPDETLVWYEGSAVDSTTRRFLHADERGSIIAVTDSDADTIATYTYDEYGRPSGSTVASRFRFTGQAWFGELQLYYYKARFYHPALRRFIQPDPIGYAGGMNLYAYAGGDPVNWTDSTGLNRADPCPGCSVNSDEIVTVVANLPPQLGGIITIQDTPLVITNIIATIPHPFTDEYGTYFLGAYEVEVGISKHKDGPPVLIWVGFPHPAPVSAAVIKFYEDYVLKPAIYAAAGGTAIAAARWGLIWLGEYVVAEAAATETAFIQATGKGIFVVGRNAGYIPAAESIGARYFSTTATYTFKANYQALYSAYRAGLSFYTTTTAAPAGSMLYWELRGLTFLGINF